MYIISILALVVVIVLLALISGPGMIGFFYDFPTIILMILITFPILFASGLLKDFGKAFSIVLIKNKETSLHQLKKSVEAVSLAIKTIFYAGGFITIWGFIQVLIILDDLPSLGAVGGNFAVAILASAYAFAINIILISIKYKLKLLILNFTQD